ncbi:MAG: HAMP domain-containing histidine kinase [Gammaproteobacteria bacterium]|nr:HAMP domain-containing histidine kinase [Gammaproteobacteria bacterium]
MNITSSLATRIIGLFIALMVIILLLFAWFISQSTVHNQQVTTQALHQELAKNMIKENQLFTKGKIDPVVLDHVFHSMMLLGPAFEIYVVDLSGNILAFSAPEGKVKRRKVDVIPLKQFIDKQSINKPSVGKQVIGQKVSWPLLGDDPRHLLRTKIFSAALIYQNQNQLGYLYVIIGSELQDNLDQNLLGSKIATQTGAIFIGALLFALLASIIIVLAITKPLRALNSKVVSYHKNQGWRQGALLDPSPNVMPPAPGNEVAQLNHVINQMAVTINEQFEQLATIDLQRKELLSYISHDLRTPLASLTGYLETWQQQQAKPVAQRASEQDHYIDIALKNAKTLSSLVEQVFELAHLETGSVELDREPVAVAELAQDIIESFKLRAQTAQVTLTVSPRDSSIQVDADIAKLERVLGNLVANAIRHTPPDGQIEITFESIELEHQPRILIRVSDTGAGIPKDALPRVFEAHFRAANAQDGTSQNAGLGLAIVKELLALHQTNITVSSIERQGTTFSFSLPQYLI